MTELVEALKTLGITLPTPAYLVGVLIFGVIGIIAFAMGRRRSNKCQKWLGLALMLYPYGVWSTLPLYLVGLALCIALLWCTRRRTS